MRFTFTGELMVNGEETKNPFIRVGKTANGNEYKTFNCGLKAAQNNAAWGIELFGMKSDDIKTMDADGNKITISWGDRDDEDIVKTVASYRKNVVNIGERKEFISPYDTVSFLADNIDEIKNNNITITGQVNKNFYNGRVTDRFQIQNVYLADEDAKNQFRCSDTYYFCKDSFELEDWKSEKKITINGWVSTYISDLKANKYVEHPIVFDCSKVDFDNEKHRKLVNFKLKMIGCELTSDNKIKVNLKKNVYAMPVILNYMSGAEEEEFDESMLSAAQKEAIELGLKKLDDFKSKVYGQRVTVYKLVDFDLREISNVDYSNGCVDTETSISEFEEDIYKPEKPTETLEDAVKNSKKKTEEVEDDEPPFEEEEEEDLFS